MANYVIPEEPGFTRDIRQFEVTDPAHADLFNAVIGPLLENDVFLKTFAEKLNETIIATYQQATGYTDQQIADLINGAPSTLDTLGEIASAMGDNADVVAALESAIGNKADQKEMENLLGIKLDKTEDTKDNTVTFGSIDTTTPSAWTDVAVMVSGEKHKSLFNKLSTMMKNVRWLYKMLGTTNIASIGDGTLTGAISALNTGLANAKGKIPTALTGITLDYTTDGVTKNITTGQQTIVATATINKPGCYLLLGMVSFDPSTAGSRGVWWSADSTGNNNAGFRNTQAPSPHSTVSHAIQVCRYFIGSAGAKTYLVAYQTSGTTLKTNSYIMWVPLWYS